MQDELVKVNKKRKGSAYLKQNMDTFNADAKNNFDRVKQIFTRTKYWIYDSKKKVFGPSKYLAYENMSFDRYEFHSYNGVRGTFNGTTARKAVEALLSQKFEPNPLLHNELCFWAERLTEPDLFKNITESKWKFLVI